MSLIDQYKVITVTHHNLDIADIGNFYVHVKAQSNQEEALRALKEEMAFDELMYLETCNRVCFIVYCPRTLDSDFLRYFFETVNPNLAKETLDHIHSFAELYQGESAIKHVFEMASSMDSLVIGEREIFRQFRSSYNSCLEMGLVGDNIRLLEKATVATAKRVYNETKIAEKPLSVVSLAIQAMIKANASTDQRVLLIGSGETNTLVGKFLKKYQINKVSIYNRSIDNARALADMLNADSYHLSELDQIEAKFDTIIICTSANQIVIDDALYSKMIKGDGTRKLLIDLAVPRNISKSVVEKNNVEYIDISRLKKISEKNLSYRKAELDKAEPIIFNQILSFKDLYQQRQLEKAFSHIPSKIRSIKEKAVNEVYSKRISKLDEESRDLLLEMMSYMEKKCISVPMKTAREELY